ncbi:hydrogenase formation protein HypD [Cyanobium sp. Morenito 9A2]|uniref:hydrogenase formation protein HypD n=1 Tax=Cyanobium sp. Morenito 9A2 TaxID=2823718 RepID=UPI0020CE40C6|nr:hydrogenase formation protein HypD [Cyanobium sp. Morenito 9A2]
MSQRLDPPQVAQVQALLASIRARLTRPWTLMEVCGGQTHAILRHGLDQLLPPELELIHGPGCPVCVTDAAVIDRAQALAATPGVLLCTYGDMLRVPGSSGIDLLTVRSGGGRVRIVYAPLDVLAIARAHPELTVVFLAVGFETTAPATALLAHRAWSEGLTNLKLLVSLVRVPPALEAILAEPEARVQGFLAAGHVAAVMGLAEYEPIAQRHRVPIVVTGFGALELLEGVLRCVSQLEQGEHRVENAYLQGAPDSGNGAAQALIERVFAPCDRLWRGLGVLRLSGLCLRAPYVALAADGPHQSAASTEATPLAPEEPVCLSGRVLQGLARPTDCPSFGTHCSPDRPLGAPMVSSEGACAAYHRYRP